MVMPHTIGQSLLIIYSLKRQTKALVHRRAVGWLVLCVGGMLSAGCGESDSAHSESAQSATAPAATKLSPPELVDPGAQAAFEAEATAVNDTLAGAGALGGAMRLSAEVTVIYGIEYADGQAVMSSATVLRGTPGWQDRANRSTAGKITRSRKLTHVGIGGSAGSHSAVFDPATKQLWIDDNQVMPLRRNNVVLFKVPDEPEQPLVLIGQQRICLLYTSPSPRDRG